MQSKIANLPDRSIRYLESGSGRAVVLVHGFPLSADQWLPQLTGLPLGWRAIAPDLRGFRGAGPAWGSIDPETTTMDSHAADVLALMTHLEIDRAAIVGLSMGGYVAFAIFKRARARVAGLLLANTRAGADSTEGLAARDRMIALAETDGPAGVASGMVPKLIGRTSQQTQPDLADAIRQMIEHNSTPAIVSAVRAMKMRPDSTPLLAGVGCPTLVVSGDEDALIPAEEIEVLHQQIPGATHVALSRVGHMTNLEAPNLFNDAMAGWLGRL